MARGRSAPDFEKVYISGYDLSAYTMKTGPCGIARLNKGEATCLADAGGGTIPGKVIHSFGPLQGVFDNTALTGLHVLQTAANGTRQLILRARGVQAAPAIGDDAFCLVANQLEYMATETDKTSTVNVVFEPDQTAGLNYTQVFGALMHTFASYTGANSANTNHNNGAATATGGWFMWMIRSITGAGTVTVSVDDSANGTAWLALSGATSGAIATASAPIAGFVQLATNADVRQYLRPQIALGGSASAAVVVSAFMRQ